MHRRVLVGKIVRWAGMALLSIGGPVFMLAWIHPIGGIAFVACLGGLLLYFAGSAIAGRNLSSPWEPVKRWPPRWPALPVERGE